MNKIYTENTNTSEVNPIPFEYTLSLIGGKWKLNIRIF